MSSLDVLNDISNSRLINCNQLRYCLVDETKVPYKVNGMKARPNQISDFVDLETLVNSDYLTKLKGIGISIQASKVTAIDIDHCIVDNKLNDLSSKIIEMFKNYYVEKSFSKTGIRIIFKNSKKIDINSYNEKYKTKNSNLGVEFYSPEMNARYVTVTGDYIYNNEVKEVDIDLVYEFLNQYMKKEIKIKNLSNELEILCFEDIMKKVKKLLLLNDMFQNNWFENAPGSNSNESERDASLVHFIKDNLTKDRDMAKKIFEESPFFKSKDEKHLRKWNYNNNSYFDYMWNYY